MAPQESPRKSVLILADDMVEEGGIRSRILGELEAVQDLVDPVFIVRVRSKNIGSIGDAKRIFKRRIPGASSVFVPVVPHRGISFLRFVVTGPNLVLLLIAGIFMCLYARPHSIYSHNTECSIVGIVLSRLFRRQLTTDFHGDEVEEISAASGWDKRSFSFRFWKKILHVVLSTSPQIVCVSNRHRSHFESSYGTRNPISVIPCCVRRIPYGSEHHGSESPLPDGESKSRAFTLFYAGSPSSHQLLDKMATFFDALCKSDQDVGMVMLVPEKKSIGAVLQMFPENCRSKVDVYSVDQSQVSGYASRAHAGLLFREDVPFNNVSSPTKFAEYLISGLPVLITKGVGDYSDLVERERLGKIVNLDMIRDPGYASSIITQIKMDREIGDRCIRYALLNLTWDSQRQELVKLFNIDVTRRRG